MLRPLLLLTVASFPAFAEQPNVVFIAVDDLRPELGCYGVETIQTPNIDRLAAQGTTFLNSFCNIPVCGASRASVLTGMRPTRNRFLDYDTRVEQDTPEAVTIPGHFKANGYHSVGFGKIAHFRDDKAGDWSEAPWRPDFPGEKEEQVGWQDYQLPFNNEIVKQRDGGSSWPYESADVPDDAYFDGKVANKAAETIETLAKASQPFFVAVGFVKPHLPFNAPKRYWDLYEREQFSLPENYYPPRNAPGAAIHQFGELRSYYGVPKEGPLSDEMAITLIHGYHAATSYADACVGTILDAIEASGEADNTIVVLWGDHGWNLGEHTLWCKHANFMTSLRAPLIISPPGGKRQSAKEMVEFIDIYPTLCDLAEIPKPKQLEGQSLAPNLDNPEKDDREAVHLRWKDAATIKTRDFSYTEWTNDEGQLWGKMLYDHRTDPEENVNVVDDPGYQETVEGLAKRLIRK